MSDWTGIASIVTSGVGCIAVTVALLYSSRQARTLREQLELDHQQVELSVIAQRAGNDLKLMGHTMDLDRLFIDVPALRPFFYDGREVPDDEPLRARVIATAELIIDLADSVANMIRLDQLDSSDRKAWAIAFGLYGRSPAVRLLAEDPENRGAWREPTLALLRGEADEIAQAGRGAMAS